MFQDADSTNHMAETLRGLGEFYGLSFCVGLEMSICDDWEAAVASDEKAGVIFLNQTMHV